MDHELTYKWIQDRLRDLQSGQLTAQDKARLEAIALDNPFVADAIEGYASHPDAMHEAYLAALAEKIRQTPRGRRRWLIPNLTVTAIAASVMLIIATYAVVSRMMPPEEKELIVILHPDSLQTADTTLHHAVVWNEDKEDQPAVTDPPSAAANAQSGKESKSSTPQQKPPTPAGSPVAGARQTDVLSTVGSEGSSAIPESTTIPAEAQSTLEESAEKTINTQAADNVALSAPDKEDRTVSGKDMALRRDEGYYANQIDPDLMARRATGRILNPSGDPLIGADIRVANTNLGVSSMDEGRFELFLPLPQSEVDVFLPGYAQAHIILEQGEMDKDIVLEPSVENPGSYRSKESRDDPKDDAVLPSATGATRAQSPQDGWTQYLKDNSKIPLRENYYMPGHEVTIKFTVSRNGKAEALKLIRSSGDPQYDQEAMRLIRGWAHWTCAENACDKEYTLYFR